MYTTLSVKLRPVDVLRSSCPKDIFTWFYKAKKSPRHKDFCMNVILLKFSPQHSRLTICREGIGITCLTLNNKTYIFTSSKISSNSI